MTENLKEIGRKRKRRKEEKEKGKNLVKNRDNGALDQAIAFAESLLEQAAVIKAN